MALRLLKWFMCGDLRVLLSLNVLEALGALCWKMFWIVRLLPLLQNMQHLMT